MLGSDLAEQLRDEIPVKQATTWLAEKTSRAKFSGLTSGEPAVGTFMAVELFVVAGALGLAIAQRRRETAVLRALGASPGQVRRLIAAESLILSLVAGGLGIVLGGPLACALAQAMIDHGAAPLDFEPGHSLVPLAAALGMGVLITQLAVVAAAHRAARIPPADALREVAIEHSRPGLAAVLSGLACLGGGVGRPTDTQPAVTGNGPGGAPLDGGHTI